MNEVISIKYGCSIVAWTKLMHPRLKFKIQGMSKSIPAAKSQNFIKISVAQKPTWANVLEFDFFICKGKVIQILPEEKLNCGHIIFMHKSCNEVVDEMVFIRSKTGQK